MFSKILELKVKRKDMLCYKLCYVKPHKLLIIKRIFLPKLAQNRSNEGNTPKTHKPNRSNAGIRPKISLAKYSANLSSRTINRVITL